MLSPTTLALLTDLQIKSAEAWPQGGLMYTYTEGASQAHFRFPEVSADRRQENLSSSEKNELARFIQASQGDYLSDIPTTDFLLVAERLLATLRSDISFNEITWVLQDGGHDMAATLKLARRADNRYFSLELSWSID